MSIEHVIYLREFWFWYRAGGSYIIIRNSCAYARLGDVTSRAHSKKNTLIYIYIYIGVLWGGFESLSA